MKHTFIFALSLLMLSTAAEAKRRDPNLSKEGNMLLVKREACIRYGGHVTDTDKRYFMCEGGKYDGIITSGPVSEPEGDEEEVGHP